MKTELDEIYHFTERIIAKEDKYFYYHPGVNGFAMTRALVKMYFGKRFRRIYHYHASMLARTQTQNIFQQAYRNRARISIGMEV